MRIQRLTKDAKENLLEDLLKRSPNNYGQYEQGVQEILAHVKEEKDQAVFAYTKKFDHADITAENIKLELRSDIAFPPIAAIAPNPRPPVRVVFRLFAYPWHDFIMDEKFLSCADNIAFTLYDSAILSLLSIQQFGYSSKSGWFPSILHFFQFFIKIKELPESLVNRFGLTFTGFLFCLYRKIQKCLTMFM